MKRGNIILLVVALFGLVVALVMLTFAIRFFRSANEFIKNTPIATYHDSLTTGPVADSLNSACAEISRQLAVMLQQDPDKKKENKLEALFNRVDEYLQDIDSIRLRKLSRDESAAKIHVAVNKLNLGSREGLFDSRDDAMVPMLNELLFIKDKAAKTPGTQCISGIDITDDCYEKLKQDALVLKLQILQADLQRLKNPGSS
jgi:hypothetical protein